MRKAEKRAAQISDINCKIYSVNSNGKEKQNKTKNGKR